MPRISIIVPCFNQAQYLSDALDSVINQTFSDWECIIVNDGSTDNTDFVSKKYCTKDNRFKLLNKLNGGLSSARNAGIRISNSEFILPLDADDYLGKDYLEKAIEHFNEFPETKLVYCNAELFGAKNGHWDLADYDYKMILTENIIFCSALFRKKDFDDTNGYNEDLDQGYEDWDFWLSFLKKNDLVYKIPITCFYYRIKENSMTTLISDQTREEIFKKIFVRHEEKYDDFLPELIWRNPKVKIMQTKIDCLEKEIRRIQLSRAYRLGKILLKPFSAIKTCFNNKFVS